MTARTSGISGIRWAEKEGNYDDKSSNCSRLFRVRRDRRAGKGKQARRSCGRHKAHDHATTTCRLLGCPRGWPAPASLVDALADGSSAAVGGELDIW